MEQKNNGVDIKKEKNKPVVVTVKTKREVAKPKVEIIETEKSLEDHLKENRDTHKKKVNIKHIITYLLLFIILGVCIFFIMDYYKKNGGFFKEQITTTTRSHLKVPTTTTTKKVVYQTTTTVATKATHTVFKTHRVTGGGKVSTTAPSTTRSKSLQTKTTTIKEVQGAGE